jgi:hypothetical protein
MTLLAVVVRTYIIVKVSTNPIGQQFATFYHTCGYYPHNPQIASHFDELSEAQRACPKGAHVEPFHITESYFRRRLC